MAAKHPDCETAGCMVLVNRCQEGEGCALAERHQYCPDEQGICLHGEDQECPPRMAFNGTGGDVPLPRRRG